MTESIEPPISTALPDLPTEFLALLGALVPAELRPEVDASYCAVKAPVFRINTLLADAPSVLAELAGAGLIPEVITGFPDTYRLPAAQRETLTYSMPASDGRIYIQGLSSMAAILALDPQPGEEILDLAAAPGGKTSLIAARMANQGRLAAVEAVKPRYFRLKANLQRLGVTNTQCYLKDGAIVGKLTPERFDRVLLDAPCSSEAQFTRLDAASWAHWSPRKVKEMARKQGKLLRSAIAALKPGGVLAYCTCALSPDENEVIVSEALARHPEMSVETIALPPQVPALPGLTTWKGKALDERVQATRRILPGADSDAFFICRLRKAGA